MQYGTDAAELKVAVTWLTWCALFLEMWLMMDSQLFLMVLCLKQTKIAINRKIKLQLF